MNELAEDIRRYIDSAAPPVTLEEVRGGHHLAISDRPTERPDHAGASMRSSRRRPGAGTLVRATVIVVAVLVGVGLLVVLGPRSSRPAATRPPTSALAPSHRALVTARQAIAMELPTVAHATRTAAKLTTYGQVLAVADPQASFPGLGATAVSARVWVVALAGAVRPGSTMGLIPEHYTWEAVFINQQTGKALGSVYGSTGDWPPFFNALPDLSGAHARPRPVETTVPVPAGRPIVLNADGIGSALFGQPESTAIANLKEVFGAPLTSGPTPSNNCRIDAFLQWSTLTAYFDGQRFVGYGTGSLIGGPGYRDIPNVITAMGLKIGDSLGQAQHLYGTSLRTSLAQGGIGSRPRPPGP